MLRVPCSKRPSLIGSPMRTPQASPQVGPSAWPQGHVPALALDGDEQAALQAAIEASLGDDMKRRLQASLQSTEKDLWAEYPEEAGTRDIKRARLRSSSDLEAATDAASRGASRRASPKLGPGVPEGACQIATEADIDFQLSGGEPPAASPPPGAPAPAASLEFEGLLDHELLLESIYGAQGLDLRAQQETATKLLAEVGLRALDLGVKNWDEDGREMLNQCFYLSIARSYLGPHVEPQEMRNSALLFKRTVEACVLAKHPEWATDQRMLGENAMAFADFLPIAMGVKDPPNLAARLAVLILDTTQGHAEVYLGPDYAGPRGAGESARRDREELERHLVLLCYTPGHYKALVQDDAAGSKPAWTYFELKDLLDKRGVMCIETSDFD
mmetsp:Transcript_95564/g.259371  ORF Transcript_95564/g.259371 Transcript_95564/m.259371 type:complete len:386 (-) Transcript_95564:88-1245(-)